MLLIASVALGLVASFWLGVEVTRRWPLESVERLLGISRHGWVHITDKGEHSYESGHIRLGSRLYVFGGALGPQLGWSQRARVFDLETRAWRELPPVPPSVGHAQPVMRSGRLWFAGGRLEGTVSADVWSFDTAGETWRQEPSLPEARLAGSLISVEDTLHFMGGYDLSDETAQNDHWVLAPDASEWDSAPPLPQPKGHHASVRLGRELWVVGGTSSHHDRVQDLNSVEVYDLDQKSWAPGPSLPFGISHAEALTFAYENQIYVVGGRAAGRFRMGSDAILTLSRQTNQWTHAGRLPTGLFGGGAAIWSDTLFAGLGVNSAHWDFVDQLWARPLRDAWYLTDPMPIELGEVSAAVIDDRLYVVGERSTLTQSLDLNSGLWSPRGTLSRRPLGGHHHAAEVSQGRLLLLGGLGGSHNNAAGSLQIYDPGRDEWTLGPRMPYPGGSVASARIGDHIYVAGGIVGDTTTRQAASLDLKTMTWTRIDDMPVGRNHAAAGTDGERFFVFGGRGPGSGDANVVADGFDDVQVFDPRTGAWVSGGPGNPPPLPQGRGGMGKAVYIAGEFWVIGGETRSGEGATADGTYARVDIYNVADRQWRRGRDMRFARHGIFPVVHDGRVIVAAGGTRSGYSSSSIVEAIWPR